MRKGTGTMAHYRDMSEQIIITAVGGCSFAVRRHDPEHHKANVDGYVYLGTVAAGETDEDGQWIGDESDVESAVHAHWEWGVAEDATFHHKW